MKKQRKNTLGRQKNRVSVPFVSEAADPQTGGNSLPPPGGGTTAQVAALPKNPFMPQCRLVKRAQLNKPKL